MSSTSAAASVSVAADVFEVAPAYAIAAFLCRGVAAPEAAEGYLTQAEDELRLTVAGGGDPLARAQCQAWRAAYAAAGISASRYPDAASALARRVVKGGRLPRLGYLVDLCNAAALASGLPVASCSLDTLARRHLSVARASGTETFRPINAIGDEHPRPGEIIYRDPADRAHSRRWNWRQSDQVKTTSSSRTVLVLVESVSAGCPPLPVAERLAPALARVSESIDFRLICDETPQARWAA